MRKFLFATLIVIIAVVLALPFAMGKLIGHQFKQQVSQINKISQRFHIKIIDYREGWFSSFAQLEITKKISLSWLSANAKPSVIDYIANLTIHHSPIALAYNLNHQREVVFGHGVITGDITAKNIPAELSKTITIENLQPSKIFALTSLNGNLHFSLLNPGFKIVSSKTPLTLSLSAIHSSFNLLDQSTYFNGEVNVGALKLTLPHGEINGQTLSSKFSYTPSNHGFVNSAQSGKVGTITASYRSQTMATLKNIAWHAKLNTTNNKLQANYFVKIANANLLTATIKQITMAISADNINLSSLKKLKTLARSKSFKALPRSKQTKMLLAIAGQTLAGAHATLKTFQAITPIGKISAAGGFQFAKAEAPNKSSIEDIIQNSRGALIIHTPSELSNNKNPAGFVMGPGPVVPKEAVYNPGKVMLYMMIDSAFARGYLIKEKNNRLMGKLTYHHGILRLNEKPIFKFSVAHRKNGSQKLTTIRLHTPSKKEISNVSNDD